MGEKINIYTMFILQFLPNSIILWFTNILLIVGIALTVASFFADRIPFVSLYQLPFKILGIALLVLGVYFRGGLAVEQVWRERVKEVEARVVIAEEKSKKVIVQIETKVITKTRIVKQRGKDIITYVDREIIKYDNQCVIPDEFIKVYNDAAAPLKDAAEKPK